MPDEPIDVRDAEGAHDRIADDHRDVASAVRRLEGTTDLRLLLPQLHALHALLARHFALEEGPDGFHRVIGESAPVLLNRVSHLFEEHQRFLASLADITRQVEECLDGPVAQVLSSVAALSRRLREHEAMENELLADSVYTDFGTGD